MLYFIKYVRMALMTDITQR